jgi:hypothetical protein
LSTLLHRLTTAGGYRVRRARPAMVLLAALGVASCALFSQQVFGGRVLSSNDIPLLYSPFSLSTSPENPLLGDPAYVFHPDLQEVRESLRDGRLPLWMSEVGAGRPLLASQQVAPLYPLTWLAVVMPFWQSLVVIAIAKVMIAGVGTFALSRALGLGPMPAALAAVSYAFSAYFVVWLQHPHTNAYSLLPLAILAVHRVATRPGATSIAGLAVVTGLTLLGGHPQSAALVLLAAGAYAATVLTGNFVRPQTGSSRHRARCAALGTGALVAGSGLGIAAAAVMLIPFVEILQEAAQQSRSSPPMAAKTLITAFFPEFWGRSDAREFGGPLNFAERVVYVGVIPLILAAVSFVAVRDRAHKYFMGLAVVSSIIAVDLGLLTRALRFVPPLDRMGAHRAVVLVSFGLAMSAGYGLQALQRGAVPRRVLGRVGVVAALAPVVLWALVTDSLSGVTHGVGQVPALSKVVATVEVARAANALRWALFSTIGVILLLAVVRRCASRYALPLVVAITAVDLVTLTHGYHTALPLRYADPPRPPALDALGSLLGDQRFLGLDNALGPNQALKYDLRDARAHDLPVPSRYFELWTALGGTIGSRALAASDQVDPKLMDLFAASHILGAPDMGTKFGPVIYRDETAAIAENSDTLPRAYVAYSVRRVANQAIATETVARSTAAQLLEEPVVEASTRPIATEVMTSPTTPAVAIDEDDHLVRVRFTADRPGRLVLMDSFYPGWQARLGGKELEIAPTNAAFRSVPVPAGSHEVVFSYEPASVRWGVKTSLTASALVLVMLLVGAIRRWRRRSSGA